jgi:hypothetical protein
MLYTFDEIVAEFGNNYQIHKKIEEGKLQKVEPNIYTDSLDYDDLMILIKKYCDGQEKVFTLQDSLKANGMIKKADKIHYLATDKDASKIKDPRIKQIFSQKEVLTLGRTVVIYKGIPLPIYDKERTLIELCRYRSKIPANIFAEAVQSYRREIAGIDQQKLTGYLAHFPKLGAITNRLDFIFAQNN